MQTERVIAAFPRHDGERRRVRVEVHIALGDPCKALNGTAVEPGTVIERIGQPVGRDSHTLDNTDDVGELEVDKADLLPLALLQDVLL